MTPRLAGNVKSETDGNDNVSTFNYNELNQRTDELRPLGRNRLFTYTVLETTSTTAETN